MDATVGEIDVLDPQAKSFERAHARAVQQRGEEPGGARHLRKQGMHLVAAQHDRKGARALGPCKLLQLAKLAPNCLVIEKDQSVERLVLGAGADPAPDGQMIEEGLYLAGADLSRALSECPVASS